MLEGKSMEFTSQIEAKNYFANKIISEAKHQGTPLSQAQRYMLLWSESDPNFQVDPQLNSIFENENSDKEFEEMVRKLIKQAYQRDLGTAKPLADDWRKAYKVLSEGDHYILIMIKDVVGNSVSGRNEKSESSAKAAFHTFLLISYICGWLIYFKGSLNSIFKYPYSPLVGLVPVVIVGKCLYGELFSSNCRFERVQSLCVILYILTAFFSVFAGIITLVPFGVEAMQNVWFMISWFLFATISTLIGLIIAIQRLKRKLLAEEGTQ
jgi:hypothetical protein